MCIYYGLYIAHVDVCLGKGSLRPPCSPGRFYTQRESLVPSVRRPGPHPTGIRPTAVECVQNTQLLVDVKEILDSISLFVQYISWVYRTKQRMREDR